MQFITIYLQICRAHGALSQPNVTYTIEVTIMTFWIQFEQQSIQLGQIIPVQFVGM